MSLPKSIVAVREYLSTHVDLGTLHLFEKNGGSAICGIRGTSNHWFTVGKKVWDNAPQHCCGRCAWSLRRRERAALGEKAE